MTQECPGDRVADRLQPHDDDCMGARIVSGGLEVRTVNRPAWGAISGTIVPIYCGPNCQYRSDSIRRREASDLFGLFLRNPRFPEFGRWPWSVRDRSPDFPPARGRVRVGPDDRRPGRRRRRSGRRMGDGWPGRAGRRPTGGSSAARPGRPADGRKRDAGRECRRRPGRFRSASAGPGPRRGRPAGRSGPYRAAGRCGGPASRPLAVWTDKDCPACGDRVENQQCPPAPPMDGKNAFRPLSWMRPFLGSGRGRDRPTFHAEGAV